MMWCVNLLVSLYATLLNMFILTSKIINIGTNNKFYNYAQYFASIFQAIFMLYTHYSINQDLK